MMREGVLKVWWVACSNPAVSLPDLNRLFADLDFVNPQRPFVVVQDIYDPMETKVFADLFLSAAQWAEKTGTYTCSERRVNLGRQAVTPPDTNCGRPTAPVRISTSSDMVADRGWRRSTPAIAMPTASR
ncbi:MAG: molybdopterin-dependent oxidoreductase [Comamonadaceae bacterium]|nr:molybdopterin-dependent oxidoreductase [Comamonadaceae bacterium]